MLILRRAAADVTLRYAPRAAPAERELQRDARCASMRRRQRHDMFTPFRCRPYVTPAHAMLPTFAIFAIIIRLCYATLITLLMMPPLMLR